MASMALQLQPQLQLQLQPQLQPQQADCFCVLQKTFSAAALRGSMPMVLICSKRDSPSFEARDIPNPGLDQVWTRGKLSVPAHRPEKRCLAIYAIETAISIIS